MPEAGKDIDDKLLDFCKEAYLYEADRREKISARLTLNLAVLTIAANICVSYLNHLPPLQDNWLTRGFYVLITAAIMFGLTSLIFFFRALGFPQGYQYGYIPKTTEIYRFLKEAEAYNQGLHDLEPIDLQKAFRDNLTIQYNGYASRNAENNHRKSKFVWITFSFSICAIIFLLLTAPLFYALKYSAAEKSQLIEITKPVKIEK